MRQDLIIQDNDGDTIQLLVSDTESMYVKVRDISTGQFGHVDLPESGVDSLCQFLIENFPTKVAAARVGTPAAILDGASRILSFERVGDVGAFTLHHMEAGTSVVYAADGSVTITKN